jgi:hypothetical protein
MNDAVGNTSRRAWNRLGDIEHVQGGQINQIPIFL